MLVDIIAGARPNFIKIAPLINALKVSNDRGSKLRYRLIHTGQHYDENMSGSFFTQLNIPTPDIHLNVRSGSQAQQTGSIMERYEELLLKSSSQLCIVVGDVTSTMACAITAKKLSIPVAHIEAGIRSGDMTMPEEINRIVTDSISDLFFTTTKRASYFLKSIGADPKNIHFVGNIMIDTLIKHSDDLIQPKFFEKMQLEKNNYFMLTLHRPSNVDQHNQLIKLLRSISSSVRNLR